MSDTKSVSVVEEIKQEFEDHIPTDKEEEVVEAVFQKFRLSANQRNREYEYLDGESITAYIEDSVRRFTTNIDEREDIEDWQARVHDPFTRNKVLAILGQIVKVLPIARLKTRGSGDPRKGLLLTNLYEYSEDADDYEELLTNILLECIVKGTAIGYEGHEKHTKLHRDVTHSGDEITISNKKEITNKLFGGITKLEEFYPSSVGIRNIKKLPYCFWRKIQPLSEFQQDWAMFDRVGLVQPQASQNTDEENQPYYLDFISDDVPDGSVEIIRYYNKEVDEYVFIANGIWLNPIKIGDEKMEISPLPFNHKELPFWDIRFDLFGSDFFFGKSLPDRLKSLQDVLNVLTNMLLDQSFLTIFPPMLTSGIDSIEDDYLRPGRRTPVDAQGLSLKDQYMTIDMGTPTGWHQFILEYTRKVMEESSVDKVSSGVAGAGDRTTAEEIKTAAQGVTAMLGLFAKLVNSGIKRKAALRSANIMQFWTDSDNPIYKKVLGPNADEEINTAFNSFEIDNASLTNGKRGMRIIEMFADKNTMPTKREIKTRAAVLTAEAGKPVEVLAVPNQYIREFLFDIELVPNPKSPASKEVEKALHLEKVKTYMSFFPQLVDMNELAAQTAEMMGDDPTKVLKQGVFNTPDEGAQKSALENPAGTIPEGAVASNTARGLRGGEESSNQLRDLQNSVTG